AQCLGVGRQRHARNPTARVGGLSLHGDCLPDVGAGQRLKEGDDWRLRVLKLDGAGVKSHNARRRSGARPSGLTEEISFEYGADKGIQAADAEVDAVVDQGGAPTWRHVIVAGTDLPVRSGEMRIRRGGIVAARARDDAKAFAAGRGDVAAVRDVELAAVHLTESVPADQIVQEEDARR